MPPRQPPPAPETYQASQEAVATAAGEAAAGLLPDLDVTDLTANLPAFKAAVIGSVTDHAQAAGTLAVQQYQRGRRAAGVTVPFRPRVATPPSREQIAASVDWATQPLWDSAILAATVPGAPVETQEAASAAVADAKARLAASSARHVGETGARTITENAGHDRAARGYARIPEAGACSFCLMLALRGAVYKDDRGGGRGGSFAASNAKFKGDKAAPSTIKVHDRCHCHPEPVWGKYEPPARVREAEALYKTHVTDAGRKGKDARIAYRQAVEGREVTGLQRDTPKSTPAKKATTKPGERTSEQIQAEINALEHNLPRLTNDQQRAWTAKRIAALRQQLKT